MERVWAHRTGPEGQTDLLNTCEPHSLFLLHELFAHVLCEGVVPGAAWSAAMLSFVRRPDICGLRLLAVFRPQALGAEVYFG